VSFYLLLAGLNAITVGGSLATGAIGWWTWVGYVGLLWCGLGAVLLAGETSK
jgi:hypothetical protein